MVSLLSSIVSSRNIGVLTVGDLNGLKDAGILPQHVRHDEGSKGRRVGGSSEDGGDERPEHARCR